MTSEVQKFLNIVRESILLEESEIWCVQISYNTPPKHDLDHDFEMELQQEADRSSYSFGSRKITWTYRSEAEAKQASEKAINFIKSLSGRYKQAKVEVFPHSSI